jgi:hypothetical protein
MRNEGDLNLSGNGSRDLGLQRKDVVQISFITLGPDVAVGLCIDELRRDAHPVAGTQYRAF